MTTVLHSKKFNITLFVDNIEQGQSGHIHSSLQTHYCEDDDETGCLVIDVLESFLLAMACAGVITEFTPELETAIQTTLDATAHNLE